MCGFPELTHILGNLQLLLRGWAAPGIQRVGNRELAKFLGILIGNTQEAQCDGHGNFPKHLAHQIRTPLVDEAIHIVTHQLTYPRFMLLKVLGQEGIHQ